MIKLLELYSLPKQTEKDIADSVKMGFNKVQVGLISPKKKGVMLMNKNYEVRGVYPIEFKKVIEYLVDKYSDL